MARKGRYHKYVDILDKVVEVTGLARPEAISTALHLLYQSQLSQTRLSTQLPQNPLTRDEEKRYIYDKALVSVTQATRDFFDRSSHWYYKLEKAGVFVHADGSPIQVFRDSLGKRWFSAENMWDMAHALRRQGLIPEAHLYNILLKVQQQFVIQGARWNLVKLRQKRRPKVGVSKRTQGDAPTGV